MSAILTRFSEGKLWLLKWWTTVGVGGGGGGGGGQGGGGKGEGAREGVNNSFPEHNSATVRNI